MEAEKNVLAWSDKVVWQEGMTLDPHHFQQWDRHHNAVLNARMLSIAPYYWGLTHISIDMDRLVNGELTLLDCGGVMPDGLVFQISGSLGNAPDTRNISKYENFSPSKASLKVFLAIPSVIPDGANIRLPDRTLQRPARYLAQITSTSDETTGENERPIEIARANFRILLEGESLQGFSILQIAEITRASDGSYTLSNRYAPTCLAIGASAYLTGLTSRILQNLVTHSLKVKQRAAAIFSQRETTPQDVLVFGRLGVVNGNIPVLKHYFNENAGHPESLYLALVSLAGQLYSYIPEAKTSPNEYPAYNHGNLTHCFNKVEEILDELIREEAPSANHALIELNLLKPNVYHADIEQALQQGARLYLFVKSSQIPEHRLITELPTIARVASPGSIDMVVQAAVPALEISHTSRLPVSVPVDDKASYFDLKQDGHFWEAIKDEKALAIFLPYERSQIEIQLLVVNRK